jgi:uncharacterized membrane protein YphA (DoxX/SURF4 family)
MLLQPDDDYHGVVDTLVLALRVVLVVVFATAGIAKLRDREGSIQALKGFGVGRSRPLAARLRWFSSGRTADRAGYSCRT